MGKVHDINERKPHLSGKAICLHCGYEWVGVAPLGQVSLECPECGLGKGVYFAVVMPDEYWQCKCGCAHFCVSKIGNIMCTLCGTIQVFEP